MSKQWRLDKVMEVASKDLQQVFFIQQYKLQATLQSLGLASISSKQAAKFLFQNKAILGY